jgi:hypothetical protein
MKTAIKLALGAAGLAVAFAGASANETHFPSKSRTLTVKQPAECKQWRAPQPVQQAGVEFPADLRGTLKGDAALLVRIGTDGRYIALLDGIESHPGLMKAADDSVREWTFSPAICNGQPMAADARVDFEFRSEGAITYRPSSGAFSVRN